MRLELEFHCDNPYLIITNNNRPSRTHRDTQEYGELVSRVSRALEFSSEGGTRGDNLPGPQAYSDVPFDGQKPLDPCYDVAEGV